MADIATAIETPLPPTPGASDSLNIVSAESHNSATESVESGGDLDEQSSTVAIDTMDDSKVSAAALGEIHNVEENRSVKSPADKADISTSAAPHDAHGSIDSSEVHCTEDKIKHSVLAQSDTKASGNLSGGIIKKVIFHVDWDLVIKVHGPNGSAFYQVCSANLAAASPLWRRMIHGDEHCSSKKGFRVIEMLAEDDNSFGLDLLFSIAHFKFHGLQERYAVDQIYDIAVVANKYDCIPLLVPWTKEFVHSLRKHVFTETTVRNNDKALFVAWVLGDTYSLRYLVVRCAQEATLDADRGLLDAQGRLWTNYRLPEEIIDTMKNVRARTLRKLTEAMGVPIEYLMNSAGLITRGLFPTPNPEHWVASAETLANAYASLEVGRYRVPGTQPHKDDHRPCGFNHVEAINEILCEEVKLSEDTVAKLKQQALKSGAYTMTEIPGVDDNGDAAMNVGDRIQQEDLHIFKKVGLFSDEESALNHD
ncbi:hypothetical protein GQ53DRAFT_868912 [Thozetella sp. PMI_491]|nr:hypothetical protein GQ53DRAFT_868912 [Thozetella sp. PMI_491]